MSVEVEENDFGCAGATMQLKRSSPQWNRSQSRRGGSCRFGRSLEIKWKCCTGMLSINRQAGTASAILTHSIVIRGRSLDLTRASSQTTDCCDRQCGKTPKKTGRDVHTPKVKSTPRHGESFVNTLTELKER